MSKSKYKVCIYMVYHDDESEKIAQGYADLQTCIIPIKIETTKYFESILFTMLGERTEWRDADYVGIVKYSFERKTPYIDFEYFINHSLQGNKNIGAFTFVHLHNEREEYQHLQSMIIQSPSAHPLFHPIWYEILHVGLDYSLNTIFSHDIIGFYSNFWILKREYFGEYLEFFSEVYNQMEKAQPRLYEMLHEDSKYPYDMPKEKMLKIFDRPYITYHAFVMERLPCLFFYMRGINMFNLFHKYK